VKRGTRPATAEEAAKNGIEGGVVFTHDPLLRCRTLRRFSEDDVLSCFEAISCPTLFISTERGLVLSTKSAREKENLLKRKRAMQDLHELLIDGEGHHAHLEAPHKVLPAIRAFLQQPEPSADVGGGYTARL